MYTNAEKRLIQLDDEFTRYEGKYRCSCSHSLFDHSGGGANCVFSTETSCHCRGFQRMTNIEYLALRHKLINDNT